MDQLWIFDKNGKRRRAVKRICLQCKNEFLKRPSSKQKYCGAQCQHDSLKKRIQLTCTGCGKLFEAVKSRKKRSRYGYYFCSEECHNKSQRLDSNVIMTRPSHYGTGSCKYRNYSQKEIADGCMCGEKRTYALLIHHIDGNRKNNKKENLEVVCGTCHLLRHLKEVNGEWQYDFRALTPRDKIEKLMGR